MKFITEDDLRDLYKKEPFTEYVIEPGTRITPGARQFLADRQIYLPDEDPARNLPKPAKAKAILVQGENGATCCDKRLCSRIKSVETLFLMVAEELLNRDILLAQRIIGLKKSFSDIKSVLDGGTLKDQIVCEACTGIHEDNFSDDLDDCFEITEFHIQLAKGREIIHLHRLRCALREMELDILESFDGNEENGQCKEMLGKVNQIINTLSQLICYAAGGEKCQRKS